MPALLNGTDKSVGTRAHDNSRLELEHPKISLVQPHLDRAAFVVDVSGRHRERRAHNITGGASAQRVRLLSFDETTKLQESSITSNVPIEPQQGAPLEPVILRGAYCSGGGEAAVRGLMDSLDDRGTRERGLQRTLHDLLPEIP